nr:QueT transporter family protein [Rubrobacter sp.]
ELIFMPLVDVTGGVLCYVVARRVGGTFGTYFASLLYALWTAAGVGVVLTVSAGLPYLPSFASVAVSEIILLLLGNALLVRRV